jgi:hypothetical protein
MNFYNKIMLYFWLAVAAVIIVGTTYMVLTVDNGFKRYGYSYIFSGIAILMFLFKRWMMKRVEKHMEFLASQNSEERK